MRPAPQRACGPTPACAGSTSSRAQRTAPCRAYPRLRGEHAGALAAASDIAGLPPLARGAQIVVGLAQHDGGPTPACAGSTAAVTDGRDGLGAYPRLRGEHIWQEADALKPEGLPPLARGAQRGSRTDTHWKGPTPACAGSTQTGRKRALWPRAYPRLRGEHARIGTRVVWPCGLPPLARGARRRSATRMTSLGPTPACAGSTHCGILRTNAAEAYPRLRGEHRTGARRSSRARGLPPLARGAPDRRRRLGAVHGPTPACAGSTTRTLSTATRSRAYPRLRGEHACSSVRNAATRGLPPLARGARQQRPVPVGRAGPTPACAGSTWATALSRRTARAYPRLRGEHQHERCRGYGNPGLPPLARGAPQQWIGTEWVTRPTPACAGSTGP